MEFNSTIEITKFPIKDPSSQNIPQNNIEGFLFLELPDINSLVYLGGSSQENLGLYLFNLVNLSWSKIDLKGDLPSPMNYFAGWYDSPFLFIHGGKSLQENKSLKETYLIDISSMTIHKIFTIEEPSSRYGHSAVKNNEKQAYIFGGCNIGKKNERFLNDLHKMEYKNISIMKENNSNINGASWIVNIQTKGEKPAGRKGYNMQFIERINSLIIYGGELKDNKINDNAIYLYNIDDKEYKKINIKDNNIICSRAYSTMQLNDSENKLYIVGGINNNKEILDDIIELDLNTIDKITLRNIDGNLLLGKRYCHRGCNIFFRGEDNENDLLYHHIIIFGGKKSENEFHDNSLIDLFINDNLIEKKKIENNKQSNKSIKNEEIKFKVEDIKNEDIENNMDKLLYLKEKNEDDYNNNILPLKFTEDITKNKKYILPENNIYNSVNNNSNNKDSHSNKAIHKNNDILSQKNEEMQKKKKDYLEILSQQQKKYIELYNKYQEVNAEYLCNQNKLKEMKNKELYMKIMENLSKNKNKEKITKLGKTNGDIGNLKKKIKEIKNYNELLNKYMNIYKERFCFISDFLSNYIEDIMKLDNLLIDNGVNIQGINYDSFSNKRKRYKMLVINLCRDIKVFNIFEKELYDKLIKLKELEKIQRDINYKNTNQKENKKEEITNKFEI